MNAIKTMKNIEKVQIVFAFTAAALFIAKTVLFEPIVLCLSEWRIVNCLFALPFLAALLCTVFGRKRNPRKVISLSLYAFLPGMALSAFSVGHYCIMITVNHLFSDEYGYILFVFLVLMFCIAFLSGCFPKFGYYVLFTFLLSAALGFSFFSFTTGENLQTVEMLAYTFLFAALLFYVPEVSRKNEYETKLFDSMVLDDKDDEMRFDDIVDIITEGCLTAEHYKYAKKAYDFYYAIKHGDNDKLAQLNITGRKNIACVFELWSAYEDEFYLREEEALFFNLCKCMASEKTSDEAFNNLFYKFCRLVQSGKNLFGTMDIRLKADEPANILSNLYDDRFTFEDTEFASMESFLQGLKFKNPDKQAKVFAMSGRQAKKAGKHHNWWKLTENLYFKGEKLDRYGKEYRNLTVKVFLHRYEQSEAFRQALLDTGLKTLRHSIGKTAQRKTILTQNEFLDNLNYFRKLEFSKYYFGETEEKQSEH